MSAVVLMLKNAENGFLEKELQIIEIDENIELIESAYVTESEGGMLVHMTLTVDRDVTNEEFEMVFEHYGDNVEFEGILEIAEAQDCYNPAWELTFEYVDDGAVLKDLINRIIKQHKTELDRVFLLTGRQMEE